MPIPGVTPQLDGFLRNVYFGQVNVNNYDAFNIRTQTFFHRIDVPAAGFSEGIFFNLSNADPFVSNWPSPNGLENDKFMWATHCGFFVEFGTDAEYAPVSTANMFTRGVAATAPFVDVESIRKFVSLGRVLGRVGQRIFLDGHSPAMFPAGFSPSVECAGATTTVAASELSGALLKLGSGNGPDDAFKFAYPVPIIPQKPVRVSVQHKVPFTPSKDFVLGFMLKGLLIEPANY